jgi:hypothetical protein
VAEQALRFDRVGKGIEDQLSRLQALLQEMNERGLPGGAGAADGVRTAVADDEGSDPVPVSAPLPVPVAARDEYGLESVTGVAEQLGLGFHLGGAVERIATASALGRSGVAPLREAVWLIERYVDLLHQRPIGADLHASSVRLARTGNGIERMKHLAAELEAASALEQGRVPEPEALAALEKPEPATDHPPFKRELALMIARWVIIVVAVVAIVFAVTLISDWR